MKSFYTTIIILIIVTINLYSQFEFKDKAISDLKFQGEQFILEDSQRIIDPETLDAISEYASEFVVPPVLFEDASGLLDFEHLSLPFGGDGLGGAAWFDYNNDGFLDLILTNGKTQANALFRNNSDGTFTNVAVQAGVENTLGNSGVVAADIDNDGFKDLFLTGEGGLMGTGQSPVKLYHNNGDGTFTDITAASGIVGPETNASAAFADINNDGFLDLFITAIGSLVDQVQHANKLYLNNGDLTFTDISVSSNVNTAIGACITFFTDYDNDGWIDLFIGDCNDISFAPTPIELFRNNGDLTFTDVATQAGLTPGGFWMGFGPSDYDNDGDIDIFVTNLGTAPPGIYLHALYENNGDGTYTDVATTAGAAAFEFGWGCTFKDLDNDGYADIFFAGSLPMDPFNIIGAGLGNPGTLLFNNHDGSFTNFTPSLPINLSDRYSSGVAAGDFDNDGFEDIVIVVEPLDVQSGRPFLLHNMGNNNNWLTIRLEGTISNRDAVGARVEVVADEFTQVKEIYAGSSFLSMDSQWLTFGLGVNKTINSVKVRWPSELVELFPNIGANQIYTLVEGEGVIVGIQSETGAEIPESFRLSQNYPNPFNPTTNIKYSVPENGFVKLSIYNLVGEEVSVLVNQEVDAGFYEVSFNAANLPSGAYFYRLQASSFVETKKMVLMK